MFTIKGNELCIGGTRVYLDPIKDPNTIGDLVGKKLPPYIVSRRQLRRITAINSRRKQNRGI